MVENGKEGFATVDLIITGGNHYAQNAQSLVQIISSLSHCSDRARIKNNDILKTV